MRSSRIAGHGLRNEGRVYDAAGQRTKSGPARCECGWTSEQLGRDSLRRQAHASHKQALNAPTIRLTPPQLELLTDIATKPQMFFKTLSRWEKTGSILVRHGLATMTPEPPSHSMIVITEAGRDEAARHGIAVTRPNRSSS